MKVVVIGGTGPIGSKVVPKLSRHGHDARAAAPSLDAVAPTAAGRPVGGPISHGHNDCEGV